MSDVRKYLELIKGRKPVAIVPVNSAADVRTAINSFQAKTSKQGILHFIALYEL